MRFFRGISVPAEKADATISAIQHNGLVPDVGWMMIWEKVIQPEHMLEKHDLSLNDTRGPYETLPVAICACGEPSGAEFYAWHANRKAEGDTPIMIEIEADVGNVAVDGRDFLYTAFQLGSLQRTGQTLEKLFGPAVLNYAHRAWKTDDTSKRIALCDLAIHDHRVVTDHYSNRLVIGGRYTTVFRNAFKIRLPIAATNIVKVSKLVQRPSIPPIDIRLTDVIR